MRKPNGYGTIFKLKDKNLRKRWRVCLPAVYTIDSNGKLIKKQKVLGNFEKQTEAIRALENWHIQNADGRRDLMTFASCYNKWMDLRAQTSTNPRFKIAAKSAYQHFRQLEKRPVAEITWEELQTLFNDDPVGYATKLKNKSYLSEMYKFAIANSWATINPASYLKIAKSDLDIKRPPSNYTLDEINDLWEHQDIDACKLQLFFIYTGLRFGEIFKITEINLPERYFITGSKTDSGRNRIIPIHKDIQEIFIYLYENLFTKKSKNAIYAVFDKYKIKTHTAHHCRHTFAWLLEKCGVSGVCASKIMGHKYGNITKDIYTTLEVKDLVKAIDLIDLAKLK